MSISYTFQPDWLKCYLALASNPGTTVKEFLTFIIEQAMKSSKSLAGLIVLNSSSSPDDDKNNALTMEPASVIRVRKGATDSESVASVRALIHRCVKTKSENDQPARIVALPASSSQTTDEELFNRILNCRESLWLPLPDERRLIGWLALGADRDSAYFTHDVDSLQKLLSPAALALNRLLLRDHARKHYMDIDLIGRSEKLLRLERQIMKVAAHPRCSVLIEGERGVGKEVAAYAIHYFSRRREQPFIPVLLSSFTDSLLVDELFGHERHSFTGANTRRKGKFLAAAGGTLFLDEIGDLPPSVQTILLRVIEYGEIHPIGRDLPVAVDVRIIAATNKSLKDLVAAGQYRQDLYDRLNVIKLDIPPLRERREDIELLARHFALKQCRVTSTCGATHQYHGDEVACASREFYSALRRYDWPGNIRELENLIVWLSTMVADEPFDVTHLPKHLLESYDAARCGSPKDLRLDAVTRDHIEKVLNLVANNQTQAAKLLGIPLSTLRNKMRRLGIRITSPNRSSH